MLRKTPLIVILGSTGTGKTKLSIELAERFGGEILSADSMQVYANLNIATAKATKEEQSRAKHHLLDVAKPSEPYSVLNFRNSALPIITKLTEQSKLPIVVGGTNYYIEALLWDILINAGEWETPKSTAAHQLPKKDEYGQNLPLLSSEEMMKMSSHLLHEHLKKIDSASANRMHPNNRRKILRAIEVYQQTGKTLSSILQEQREKPGGNRLGGPLRYPHTILFWIRCRQDILNDRLSKRIDSMLEQGLLQEIRSFYNKHKLCDQSKGNVINSENLFTKGVLQTIGFKEFIPYLQNYDLENDFKIEEYLRLNAYKMPTSDQFKAAKKKIKSKDNKNNNLASNDQQSSINDPSIEITNDESTTLETDSASIPPGLELLNECLDELKLVTRRYSKKQIKWVNNRMLASRDRQVPDLYELDSSDVEKWNEAVLQPAITVIDCYRNGEVCEIKPMPKRQHPGAGLDEETSYYCDRCQRHFVGEFQWLDHLKSNKHKHARKKKSVNDVPVEKACGIKE